MTDDLVKRLRGWARDIQAGSAAYWTMDQDLKEAAARIEQLTAERDGLQGAMDYILDGMGIAELDYDFLDAANSEWVRDTLTRLAAALKGETP